MVCGLAATGASASPGGAFGAGVPSRIRHVRQLSPSQPDFWEPHTGHFSESLTMQEFLTVLLHNGKSVTTSLQFLIFLIFLFLCLCLCLSQSFPQRLKT